MLLGLNLTIQIYEVFDEGDVSDANSPQTGDEATTAASEEETNDVYKYYEIVVNNDCNICQSHDMCKSS